MNDFTKCRQLGQEPQAHRRLTATAIVTTLLALTAGLPYAAGYQRYNDGCQNCHGSFMGPVSPAGSIFPNDDKHYMHNNASQMNTDCSLCHGGAGFANPFIGNSAGTPANPGVGCTGCHGRDYGGGGTAGNNGVGLRAHHAVSGITVCALCHPGDPVPLPENVAPTYYGTVDTNCDDPCNGSGLESWTLNDMLGLDNDGDDLYDGDDPDCGPPTGACCFDDGSCDVFTEADCLALTGVWQGPDTICSTANCPQPGACCFDDGSCDELQEPDCLAAGGDWQGAGTTCASVACPQPGACCFADGSCQELFETDCLAANGTWQGPNTTCGAVSCAALGACCFADGSCQELFEAECAAGNGTWQGPNTTCADVDCAVTGACCFPDGSCTEVFEGDCVASGGDWQGPGTLCAPGLCVAIGACCFENGSCDEIPEPACLSGGGTWQGPATMCAMTECPQPGACCFPNGDCTEVFEVDCIGAGGAWQGPNTTCPSVICPQIGACCLSSGACSETLEVDCFALGGDWQGPGTSCADVDCAPPMHPQAVTDCSNCHLNPETGEPDLQGLHGNDCGLCHTDGFPGTFLGPAGTWQGECAECHNPCIYQTGWLPEHEKGHRCIACHGEQRSIGSVPSMHEEHTEKANCVVCHGFIPDLGTEIGSGNRDICTVCHGPGQYEGVPLREIHKKHVPKGVSCLECHGDERPPVDVVPGPPVGSSPHVCALCHSDEHPSEFEDDSASLHKKHTDKRLDCGACHIDANLQDDRVPMPPLDDPVRMMLDRSGYNECSHCHGDGGSSAGAGKGGADGEDDVHRKHVADQWQWCYNCHEGDDLRPIGQAPPVTRPDESCILCHDDESYDDQFPFWVHEQHAEDNKCYSCHQATPPLFDWPDEWYANEDDECACPADVDYDGEVGFADLLLVLSTWGESGQADVDRDGMVGHTDLVQVLSYWGSCM